MAAGTISKEGTRFGPCAPDKAKGGVQLYCEHIDCQQSRATARAICFCGKPIGYETRYYHIPAEHRYAHADCEEDRAEKQAQ